MLMRSLGAIAFVAATFVCISAKAQDCGSCDTVVDHCQSGCARGLNLNLGSRLMGRLNRPITNEMAASHWDSYCGDSHSACGGMVGGRLGQVFGGGHSGCGCKLNGLFGGGNSCGMMSRLGSGQMMARMQGFGHRLSSLGNGGGCCDAGGFGYPAGCGCSGHSSSFFDGRIRARMRHMFSQFGGIRLFGRNIGGGCNSGCGCQQTCNTGCNSGCGLGNGMLRSKLRGLFDRSRQMVGNVKGYFTEMVGYDYGTAGMQSCVCGMTNACCGQSTLMETQMTSATAEDVSAEAMPSEDAAAAQGQEAADAAAAEGSSALKKAEDAIKTLEDANK